LLPKQLAGGVLLATLHRSTKTQSQLVTIGATAYFKVTPESELSAEESRNPDTGESASTTVVDSASFSVGGLIYLGFTHIVPHGLDHILFVICLFLLAAQWRPLVIQVTSFTIAHSVTLALALTGIVLLPSRWVETLIAISIVVLAVENCFIHKVKPWRWMVVFLFGLIHGLGFAGAFSTLQLAPGDFLRPLIFLNLGIELGQLTVLAAMAALTWWMWSRWWYRRFVVIPANLIIAAIALWWSVERAFDLT
jgi:hydrogenase/urease accessory protein HupE